MFNELVYYSNTCFAINFIEKEFKKNKPLISLTATMKSPVGERVNSIAKTWKIACVLFCVTRNYTRHVLFMQ